MPTKYNDEQPEFVELVEKLKTNNKISHAYLIEANGYNNYKDLVIDFAKFLICNNMQKDIIDDVIKAIDNNIYNDFKIIETEGLWIKKEQILELLEEYSKKSSNNGKRVYIINEADKLNKYSANSLLKFLEDPYDDTIGILIANNKYQVIDTIRSRCQIISLKANTKNQNLSSDDKKYIVDFIKEIHQNPEGALLEIDELYFKYFITKADSINAFSLLQLAYNDIINLKLSNKINTFLEYEKDLKSLSETSSLDLLLKIQNIIIKNEKVIGYNANLNILIDKVIIEIKGVIDSDKNSRS